MSFSWVLDQPRPTPAAAADLAALGAGSSFATREEAEAWLTQHWEELAEVGVSAVSLSEGDTVVMGPMSLSQE